MQVFIIILITFGLLLVSPFLNFLGGFIAGWFIKITIGSLVASGLAMIGLNIPPDNFPILFGTIAIIGGFFKTYNFDSKSKQV